MGYYFKQIKLENILFSILPNYTKSYIDGNDYLDSNNMIQTIKKNKIIICNIDLNAEISYKLINLIYDDFIYLKLTDNLDLKKTLQYFQLTDIFAPGIDKIIIHEGIRNFYLDKGYITYADKNICRKYVGLQYWDESIRLNPYKYHF